MRWLLLILWAGLAGCPRPSPQTPVKAWSTSARYTLSIRKDSNWIRASIQLPPRRRVVRLRLMRLRGWHRHEARIRDVRCGPRALTRVPGHGWLLPPDCPGATWRIPLHRPGPGGYAVTSRLPVGADPPRWIFLVGTSVLLIPAGGRGPATLHIDAPKDLPVHHALRAAPEGRLHLAPLPDAPRWMVGAGAFALRETTSAGVRLRHLVPGRIPPPLPRILTAHPRALGYLIRVFGRPRIPRLQVFWFRLGPGARVAGGHATPRSVAVTLTPTPRPAPYLHAALRPWLSLTVLLHEQVHQLSKDLPPWIGESLAQYYALKALLRGGVLKAPVWDAAFAAISRPWTATPEVDARVRLLTAQRLYARQGRQAAFGLLYTNGARFWHAMDRAMSRHGGAGRGLDHHLHAILRLRYPRPDRVPSGLVRLLRRAAGPAADRLLGRWVRDRRPPGASTPPRPVPRR